MNAKRDIPAEWRAAAPAFADWTFAHRVNRVDVWGEYLPLNERQKGNSRTAPRIVDRGEVLLTPGVIRRHYEARDPGDIVGLHAIGADNLCREGTIDFDAHDEQAKPDMNLAVSLAVKRRLTELEFDANLIDSNGAGGFHLHVPFDPPAPASRVHHFLLWLVRDWAELGFTRCPEVFPKQAKLEPGKYGNWMRLPGRHHSRDHWSRLWVGSHWAEGAELIELMMYHRGDDPALIPLESQPKPIVRNFVIRNAPDCNNVNLRDEREIALACLTAIRGGDSDHYDSWVRVGMALHSVDSGRDMLCEWERWSRQSAKYKPGECEKKWTSFHADRSTRVTVGNLVATARRFGFDVYARKGVA